MKEIPECMYCGYPARYKTRKGFMCKLCYQFEKEELEVEREAEIEDEDEAEVEDMEFAYLG